MSKWLLVGLDGGNPLAYLAAIGTLRISSLAFPRHNAQMSWTQAEGGWRPWLMLQGEIDTDRWLAGMTEVLSDPLGQAAFDIGDDLTLSLAGFRETALKAMEEASLSERRFADFLTAFGSEAAESEVNGKKSGVISDTAFRTMSGAGHQHFLGFMRTLAQEAGIEQIQSSLLQKWTYTDSGPSMRWDPCDDRRYALRWTEPSSDPVKTVRGANRLAIEGLPLLPTAPVKRRLETTGFTQQKGQGIVWNWPIWTVPIGLDVLRSILSLAELQRTEPNRRHLEGMGIVEIYRSYRITQGKYRNFTLAEPA